MGKVSAVVYTVFAIAAAVIILRMIGDVKALLRRSRSPAPKGQSAEDDRGIGD